MYTHRTYIYLLPFNFAGKRNMWGCDSCYGLCRDPQEKRRRTAQEKDGSNYVIQRQLYDPNFNGVLFYFSKIILLYNVYHFYFKKSIRKI